MRKINRYTPMKTKNLRYLPLVLLVLAGCKPEKDDVFYLLPSPEPIQKSFAPDSVLKYLPKLGNANQLRQFPFGPVGQPDNSLRLIEFTENNRSMRYKNTFQYDQTGRLSQWTRYNKDGFIFSQHSYRYDEGGKVEVLALLNKDAPSVNYGLQIMTNDLVPSYSSLFEPVANNGALISRTDDVKTSFYIQKPGTTSSRLSFGTDGHLAKQDVLYRNGIDETISSSRIFKRNEKGNLEFIHNLSINYESVEYYTYDDKPNPFRTTGDINLLKDLIPSELAGVFNINNVMSMEIVSKEGVQYALYYVYEYRPDGYPSVMKVYNRGELISTREFKYNQ